MFRNGYVVSSFIGGVLGATCVLFLRTERGAKLKNEFIDKVSHIDAFAIGTIISEVSKEWSEFGDVVKVKARSTKSFDTLKH